MVKALESGEYWVHYFGTVGKNPTTAKFKPAFHDVNNRVTLAFKQPKKEKPWEGTAWDEMILGEVQFKKSKNKQQLVLNTAAVRLLKAAKVTINTMSTVPRNKIDSKRKRSQRAAESTSKTPTSKPKRRKKVRFAPGPHPER